MLVIVKNVSTSSEETKVIAAGEEFESDLKDLLEYVLSTYTKKQRLTHCLNFSALCTQSFLTSARFVVRTGCSQSLSQN